MDMFLKSIKVQSPSLEILKHIMMKECHSKMTLVDLEDYLSISKWSFQLSYLLS